MVSRGRARGRFPLRGAAYQQPPRRRRPPAQPRAQVVALGLVTETDAALTALVVAGTGTDTFERADGTLGAPWLAWSGALPTIASGKIRPVSTFGDASYPIAIGPDSFMEAVLGGPMQAGISFGVGVRLTAHSAAANGYAFECRDTGSGTEAVLYKGSGFTTLATSSTYTSSTVDAFRMTASGGSIKGYLRISGAWTLVVSATDTTYTAAGYPGFWVQDPTAVGLGIDQVRWGLSSAIAQTVNVGLATETETVQATTRVKRKTVGLQSETDTALAATHQKTRATGLTATTELAQVIVPRKAKIVSVGLVVETQLAQEIHRTLPSGPGATQTAPGSRGRERGRFPMRGRAWVADQRTRGQGTWAQAPRTAQIVSVGLATETELAQSLVNAPRTITIGLASETETAQRVLTARIVASGLPYPVFHIIAGPFVVPGRASETETAQTVAKLKTKAVGRAGDTEFALSIAAIGSKVINVGIAAETDTAVGITRTRPVGLVAETDTAQATTRRKTKTVGLVVETEAAQAVRAAHVRTLGIASEAQTAQAARRVKSRTLGEPLEFSTAQSHRHLKRKTLGQAQEQDAALASNAKLISVGIAAETELARTVLGSKAKAVGQAAETEAAQALRAVRVYHLGLAGGSQLAQGILAVKTVAIGIAGDIGVSQGITGQIKTIHVGGIVEMQTALGLFFPEPIGVLTPTVRGRVNPRRRREGVVSRDELDDLPVLLRR